MYLWDIMKHNIILVIGIPEGQKGDQRIENLFEDIMIKNFPDLVKETNTQVQEAQSPNQDGPKEAHIKTYHD